MGHRSTSISPFQTVISTAVGYVPDIAENKARFPPSKA
jgi:hypothetical protein